MLVQITLFQKNTKQVVDHFLVVLGVGGSEKVEGDTQFFPRVKELGVVAVEYLFRGYALFLGSYRDGGAVAVASRYHQHIVALGAVITGEDICRKIATGDVAQMQRPVGVGPSNSNEDSFGQGFLSFHKPPFFLPV